MKYHIISATLIFAAMVLYMTGAIDRGTDLGVLFLVAGFSCEFLFWTRVLRIKAQNRQKVASE